MIDLRVKRIGNHKLPPPAYARDGDAGMDLAVAEEGVSVLPIRGYLEIGERNIEPREEWHQGTLIRCGWAFEIPYGYEGQVRPRSSLSKRGIHVALGTIDSGYRGEVAVVVYNFSGVVFAPAFGERIAQMVVAPVARCQVQVVDAVSETERGESGWGSTGAR